MRNKGIIPIAALLIAAAAAIILGALYFSLKREKNIDYETLTPSVSDSADLSTIETELEDTQVGSLDSDFDELDSSASSL